MVKHPWVLTAFASVSLSLSSLADGEKVVDYNFGRPLQVAPAVDLDGTIIIGGNGAIASLTSTGAENWKVELSTGSQAAIGGISISSDHIYVSSSEGVFAFSKSGSKLWNTNLNTTASMVAIHPGGTLYVGDTVGKVHALNRSGEVLWSKFVEEFSPVTLPLQAPVIGSNGRIYISAGVLVALNPDGQKAWNDTPSFNIHMVPPVISQDSSRIFTVTPGGFGFSIRSFRSDGSLAWESGFIEGRLSAQPVIGPDGRLYLPTQPANFSKKGLVAVTPGTGENWRFDISIDTTPVISADGTIYIAGDGTIQALRPDGSSKWAYPNNATVVQGLAIGIDNTILFAQSDGRLLGLSGSSPLAASGWPVIGRDSRHSGFQRDLPSLQLLPADQITGTSARLSAMVNPAGVPSTLYFEYSDGAATIRTQGQAVPASTSSSQFREVINGLKPGVLYTVRAILSNDLGVVSSETLSFRTVGDQQEVPPNLPSLQATANTGGTIKFSGPGTIHISQPIEFKADATIDANGHEVILDGQTQSSLLKVGANIQLTLKGLSLVNGVAHGTAGGQGSGGAIVSAGGKLVLLNCTFQNNVARGADSVTTSSANAGGGAIWQSGGTLTIQNSRFINNSASGGNRFSISGLGEASGGAIYLEGATSEVSSSTFEGNNLVTGNSGQFFIEGGAARGGAIFQEGGTLSVTSTTFKSNGATSGVNYLERAKAMGGAIYVKAGSFTVSDSLLQANYVQGGPAGPRQGGPGGSAFGAALYNAGTASVSSSTFFSNQTVSGRALNAEQPPSTSSGAGIYNTGQLNVRNSTFAANTAIVVGNFSGSNFQGLGAASAVYSLNGGELLNCTIAQNLSALVAIAAEGATSLSLKNSLLADNLNQNAGANILDAGHNLSSDSTPAFTEPTSRNNQVPRLGPLGLYGSQTPVFPLLEGSPAINAADTAAAPPTDQRGRTRPFGAQADIGSFESSAPYYIWGRIQGFIDPTTILASGSVNSAIQPGGFFIFGPLSSGASQITATAQNAEFLPNPWNINLVADSELNELSSFKIHSLNYIGSLSDAKFLLVGLEGETWKIETATDLDASWTLLGNFTLDSSGMATIDVPEAQKLFLRASPQ